MATATVVQGKTEDLTRLSVPIAGMSCAACATRVEKALRAVAGVEEADVNLALERAEVKLAPGTDPGAVLEAVGRAGYKVPETRLNLTLKGVLAATPMERASAIIAKGKNGKEDIYGVGDKMPGGVVIREIHPDHVILERGGKLETLKLQKLSAVSGGMGGRVGRTSSYSSGRPSSPGAALKQIRSNIMKNPTSFGDYALPVVVKEKGKQIGYRLQPQEKGEMLAELGIQPNDIITEINGVKLDKPQNGVSALRKLSTARTLNIVVKRNGAEIPLSISLQ